MLCSRSVKCACQMQIIKLDGRVGLLKVCTSVLSLVVFLCRYAALMRASQTACKSTGAIAVPSHGSMQHNRYQLWNEEKMNEIYKIL